MTDRNLFETQRDVGPGVVSELRAAGFDDAEEIGRGGFGIVYRCTQLALDRTVAVKVLTTELDENRERFLREQRAMGRLTGVFVPQFSVFVQSQTGLTAFSPAVESQVQATITVIDDQRSKSWAKLGPDDRSGEASMELVADLIAAGAVAKLHARFSQ